MTAAPVDALARALGVPEARIVVVTMRAGTALLEIGGAPVFLKWSARPWPTQYEAEARGLAAIATATALVAVPRVLAFSDDAPAFIAMTRLTPAPRSASFDVVLGRALAELHRTTDPRGCGFDVDGACGDAPQRNRWHPDFAGFLVEERLAPVLADARARGLARAHAAAIERVVARVPELMHDGPSSLIHGDLWAGNALAVDDGRPALIDPAPCFAHRELELAMMRLMGGFSPAVYRAYEDAWPLDDGAELRITVCELWHLLNHHRIFGGSYGAEAARTAERVLAALR